MQQVRDESASTIYMVYSERKYFALCRENPVFYVQHDKSKLLCACISGNPVKLCPDLARLLTVGAHRILVGYQFGGTPAQWALEGGPPGQEQLRCLHRRMGGIVGKEYLIASVDVSGRWRQGTLSNLKPAEVRCVNDSLLRIGFLITRPPNSWTGDD